MSTSIAALLDVMYGPLIWSLRKRQDEERAHAAARQDDSVARIDIVRDIAFRAILDSAGVIADYCDEAGLVDLANDLRGRPNLPSKDRGAIILAALITITGLAKPTDQARAVFVDGRQAMMNQPILFSIEQSQNEQGRTFAHFAVMGTPLQEFLGWYDRRFPHSFEVSIFDQEETLHRFTGASFYRQRIGDEGVWIGRGLYETTHDRFGDYSQLPQLPERGGERPVLSRLERADRIGGYGTSEFGSGAPDPGSHIPQRLTSEGRPRRGGCICDRPYVNPRCPLHGNDY